MSVAGRRPGTIKLSNVYCENNDESIIHDIQQSDQMVIDKSGCNIAMMPLSIQHHSLQNICELKLDRNNIQQCIIDPNIYYNLKWLSMQHNNMHKFTIKRSIAKSQLSLGYLNLSNNLLQFIQLSPAIKLAQLVLHHNCLSTIILPQLSIQYLDISYNMFSNIQYSVLSGRVFPKLSHLNVSHNNKSLYDLVLAINNVQLAPTLTQLDCSFNILSYFQSLPTALNYLNMEQNQFIFDRKSVNQIILLTNLSNLKLTGNVICQNFLSIIKSKLERGKNKTIIDYKHLANITQSPYKLYGRPNSEKQRQAKAIQQQNIQYVQYNCFTLRNCNDNQIDPDYNLLSASFSKPDSRSHHINIQNKKQDFCNQQRETALAIAQNTLKPQKLKLNIDGDRFHNHFKFYFQQLAQFMAIPPHPILHAHRTSNISFRLDPPSSESQSLTEFNLINEMFQKRGGVQYVRKVYNWSLTQKLKKSPTTIMFINIQLSKQQFESLCNGNYQKINESCGQKHTLSPQPQSFSIYHILAKLDQFQKHEQPWSSLYIIEATQL